MDRITPELFAELLATKTDPCISLYVPNSQQSTYCGPATLRELLVEAEKQLIAQGTSEAAAKVYLQPTRSLLHQVLFWEQPSQSVALFLTPAGMRAFHLPFEARASAAVGQRFALLPLVAALQGDGRFFVLAARGRRLQLWEASHHAISCLERDLLPEDPDRSFVSKPLYEQSAGEFTAAWQSRPTAEEYLRERFAKTSRILKDFLHGEPLVFVGPRHWFDLLQEVNTYPALQSQPVLGNVSEMTPSELRLAAWSVVDSRFAHAWEAEVDRYRRSVETPIVRQRIPEIVLAAKLGKIETLFIQQGRHCWGEFREEDARVILHARRNPTSIDLLDFAACETLLHRGKAYVLPEDHMPETTAAAALLRV